MDQRPQQNRGREPVQRPSQGTGGFQVKIDQRDLMTGSLEAPRQRRGQPVQYAEPPSAKKAALTDKELKAEKRAHKKRNRIKARKNKRVFSFVWLCMVLLTSFTLASYLIGGAMDFFGDGRDTGTVDITIPEGKLTEDGLAEILYQAGAIKKPEFFSLYCKVKEDMEDFQPGTSLEVGTDLDYEALINILQGGGEVDREVVTVVFPEGFNALEGARLLEEKEVCTASEFLSALNTMDFSKYGMIGALGDTSNRYYKLEGYLFPDTYEFYVNEKPANALNRLIKNFNSKLDDELLAAWEAKGYDLKKIITIASLIERETDGSDRGNISSVIHNRLENGGETGRLLQIDASLVYAAGRAITQEDYTTLDSPYNLYLHEGLPPTPIANPGLAAVKAALSPADTDYYFYVLNPETKKHVFSETLAQHNKAVAAAAEAAAAAAQSGE